MYFLIVFDLNNFVVFCCYGLMIGVNKFLFLFIVVLKFFIFLCSYVNDWYFFIFWIYIRIKRCYFDILCVLLMYLRLLGCYYVVCM